MSFRLGSAEASRVSCVKNSGSYNVADVLFILVLCLCCVIFIMFCAILLSRLVSDGEILNLSRVEMTLNLLG